MLWIEKLNDVSEALSRIGRALRPFLFILLRIDSVESLQCRKLRYTDDLTLFCLFIFLHFLCEQCTYFKFFTFNFQ